jgi:hypothetical protein
MWGVQNMQEYKTNLQVGILIGFECAFSPRYVVDALVTYIYGDLKCWLKRKAVIYDIRSIVLIVIFLI